MSTTRSGLEAAVEGGEVDSDAGTVTGSRISTWMTCDWALLHAMKTGFEADEVAHMLARKSLVDPMDPMCADDVLSRYNVL